MSDDDRDLPIAWLTAFIDRPVVSHDPCTRFWAEVTGCTRSATRGGTGEFLTLVPPDGDAFLRVQRIDDGPGGTHLDLHTDDPRLLARRAGELGARPLPRLVEGVERFASPAGFVACAVGHHGEHRRPAPVRDRRGHRTIVDQLSIDVDPADHDAECAFWAALLGSELHRSARHDEFAFVRRGPGHPLRLMLQRRATPEGPATGHLDLACDDVDGSLDLHVAAGATLVGRHRYWSVLRDPGSLPYCLTHRDPDWGFTRTDG